MNLIWLDPERLTEEQFALLLVGCAPGKVGPPALAQKLLSKQWMAFAVDGGVVAVSKRERLMLVEALAIEGFGWRMRAFRDLMDRLAADLGCDKVQTECYDARLAKAMMRIRAKPVSWTMEWQVEGTHDGH